MAELTVLWNTGRIQASNFGSLSTHILWFTVPGAGHTWNSDRRAISSNIIVCNKVPTADRLHPAQKPVELTTFLISLLTREGDTVLDPFCGSGSTLVSAKIVGRPYFGFDNNRDCIDTARKRVQQWEIEEENPIFLWTNGRLEEI